MSRYECSFIVTRNYIDQMSQSLKLVVLVWPMIIAISSSEATRTALWKRLSETA